MSASKKNLALVLLSAPLFASFLTLMSTFDGEKNVLRMSLAGLGFIGFACLYAAVLREKLKSHQS